MNLYLKIKLPGLPCHLQCSVEDGGCYSKFTRDLCNSNSRVRCQAEVFLHVKFWAPMADCSP